MKMKIKMKQKYKSYIVLGIYFAFIIGSMIYMGYGTYIKISQNKDFFSSKEIVMNPADTNWTFLIEFIIVEIAVMGLILLLLKVFEDEEEMRKDEREKR